MLELLFSSGNPNKVKEISQILHHEARIKGLSELGFNEEIPETGSTLEENALIKARFLAQRLNCNCFADDTGLEVEALQGEPGVRSARYAGEGKNSSDNMKLLLEKMNGKTSRRARFLTVIALVLEGKEYLFEGIITGEITEYPAGTGGFGYDPVFRPAGSSKTFAEMSSEEKNKISHRAIAVQKLKSFLMGR